MRLIIACLIDLIVNTNDNLYSNITHSTLGLSTLYLSLLTPPIVNQMSSLPRTSSTISLRNISASDFFLSFPKGTVTELRFGCLLLKSQYWNW